jgi:hypothetical protein
VYIARNTYNMKIKIKKGQRFNKLIVVKELDRYILPSGQKVRRLLLKCDCGNYKESNLSHVIRGRIKSCGCITKTRNGESNTKIYKTWHSMITRCKKNYFESHLYYDRGISVSINFQDFQYFKNWAINNNYKEGLQLDRINNNKGYSENNCRFVEPIINRNNSRNTFYVKYKNIDTSVSLLLIKKGIRNHYGAIYRRIKRGWDIEKAIDTPIRKGNYKTKTRL